MVYITQTLGEESQVCGFAPNEEVEANIQELTAFGVGVVAAGEADLRPLPQIRAPRAVILQELHAEAAEDAGVEAVGGGGRRLQAHLGVGQVEHQVFPLVPHVVALEAEEEAEPVEEVHGVVPWVERRFAEVAGGAEGFGRGADLWNPEGRVVEEEVVYRNDVEGLRQQLRRRLWRRVSPTPARQRRSLPQIHGIYLSKYSIKPIVPKNMPMSANLRARTAL